MDGNPNDCFVKCDQNHIHWGAEGAAGLMLHHQDEQGTHRYLMQQRSPWVEHGDTWAPPGGALAPGETPVQGAMREANEELGQFPSSNHQVAHVNDHGNWKFHTVSADTPHMFDPELDDESSDAAWLTPEEIDEMPLHPGFSQSWADLRPTPPQRLSAEDVSPTEGEPDEGAQVLDHLSIQSIAHNLHYKYEQAPLTMQEATEYAARLLDMIGYRNPDEMTISTALNAWHQLYPNDKQLNQGPAVQQQFDAPPTVPSNSWGYSTSSAQHFAGETRNQMLQRAQALPEDQSEYVHELPGGWSMRQLQTYGDMYREGQLMNNCFSPRPSRSGGMEMHHAWSSHPQVNQGWVDDEHFDPTRLNLNYSMPYNLYSLRDPDNLPHVSVDPEPAGGFEGMALGRHNSDVKPEYAGQLMNWVNNSEDELPTHLIDQLGDEDAYHTAAVSAPPVPELYHWTDASNLDGWMDEAHNGPGSTYLTEHGDAPDDESWNPDVPTMQNPVRLTIDHNQLDPNGWDDTYHGWLNNYLYHGPIPKGAVKGIKAFPPADSWDVPEHYAKLNPEPLDQCLNVTQPSAVKKFADYYHLAPTQERQIHQDVGVNPWGIGMPNRVWGKTAMIFTDLGLHSGLGPQTNDPMGLLDQSPSDVGQPATQPQPSGSASSQMAVAHTGQILGDENYTGPIENYTHNRNSGVNPSYIGTTNGQTVYVKPEGQFHSDDIAHERAAFGLAREMGINMPHTVARTILDPREEVYQQYTDGNARREPQSMVPALVQQGVPGAKNLQDTHSPYEVAKEWPQEARHIALFDNVIGNHDRHMGNVVTDENNNLIPIDHGGAFLNPDEYYPDEGFSPIHAGTPLESGESEILQRAHEHDLSQYGLPDHEIQGVRDRIQTMLSNGAMLGVQSLPPPKLWQESTQELRQRGQGRSNMSVAGDAAQEWMMNNNAPDDAYNVVHDHAAKYMGMGGYNWPEAYRAGLNAYAQEQGHPDHELQYDLEKHMRDSLHTDRKRAKIIDMSHVHITSDGRTTGTLFLDERGYVADDGSKAAINAMDFTNHKHKRKDGQAALDAIVAHLDRSTLVGAHHCDEDHRAAKVEPSEETSTEWGDASPEQVPAIPQPTQDPSNGFGYCPMGEEPIDQPLRVFRTATTLPKSKIPIGKMTPEQVAEYKAAQEYAKSGSLNWLRDNPRSPDNIVSHWNQTTPEHRAQGMSWYQDANQAAQQIAQDRGVTINQAAGLIANYSPQQHWATNLEMASRAAAGEVIGGPKQPGQRGFMASRSQADVAARIMKGEDYHNIFAGKKITSFGHLIEHGQDTDPTDPKVVVDRHALGVAHGGYADDGVYTYSKVSGGVRKDGSSPVYDDVSNMYKQAADTINTNGGYNGVPVQPHQLQAATWLTRQRLNAEGGYSDNGAAVANRTRKVAESSVNNWNAYAAENHPALVGKTPGTGFSTNTGAGGLGNQDPAPVVNSDPNQVWSFVPPLPENEGKSTEPQEVNDPEDAWPEWGELSPDQKQHDLMWGDMGHGLVE